MNDGFLIILGLIFLFCVWVYTGGPTRPISFAGPYITPITNVGQSQSGYGKGTSFISTGSYDGNPKTGSYYTGSTGTDAGTQPGSGQALPESEVRARIADIKQQVKDLQKFGAPSPYRGKVHIESVSTSYLGQSSSNEYVTIAADQSANGVDITGWKLVSGITSSNQTIPQGEEFPGGKTQGTTADITLDSGQQARIYSGYSSRDGQGSYLENECTGYFRPADPSGYSYESCPSPQSEFRAYYSGSATDYDQCSQYINTLQSCVTPSDTKSSNISSSLGESNECINFAYSTLSYSGCVQNHQDDANFFGSTWDIYLNHLGVLWRQDSDTIKLLDRDGKTVDLYSY